MTRTRNGSPVLTAVGALLLGLLVLTGCGVPMQDEAQPLPQEAAPTPSAVTSEPRREREATLYFVSGNRLVGVAEAMADRSANGVMAALAAGPPVDRRDELRSLVLDPLSAQPLLVVTSVTPSGEVVLVRTDAFLQLTVENQLALIGQVVLSLDEVGLSRVIIKDPLGNPIPVSLPDGRPQAWPVTAENYKDLIEK